AVHVMAVGHNRRDHALRMAALGLLALAALVHRPAVILATLTIRRLQVDFFPAGIPDVADPQGTSSSIEAEAPRIAEPVRPYLAARAVALGKGVAGGARGGRGRGHVDSQNRA